MAGIYTHQNIERTGGGVFPCFARSLSYYYLSKLRCDSVGADFFTSATSDVIFLASVGITAGPSSFSVNHV